MTTSGLWRIWVDTGGTFTDCVGVAPGGAVRRLKVLSSSALRGRVAERRPTGHRSGLRLELGLELCDGMLAGGRLRPLDGPAEGGRRIVGSDPAGWIELETGGAWEPEEGAAVEVEWPEPAPVLGVRWLTATPLGAALPPLELRLATTRGTNALLERDGARCALFITRGFGDLLEIGNQARPDIFALDVIKPAPLYVRVVEVDERVAADGTVLRELELAAVRDAARELAGDGVASAAVALMHSYLRPAHEFAVGETLHDAGFSHVSLSAALAPLIKLVPRAQTAVVDAYLGPIIEEYVGRIRDVLGEPARIFVMTSAGGLEAADAYRAKDSLLSGPAGGVVGAAAAGVAAGFDSLLTFDMGGTSTDVARFEGDFAYRFEQRVGDAEIVAPTLHVETVAAGGGSVCAVTEGRLTVGPRSAGAAPGPACYGAGGPLSLTDVNLLLGRIDPGRFEIPLDGEAAARAAERVLAGLEGERDGLLAGFLQIANERMADAIRRVSIQEGYDPARCALVAFGGAGPQHACAIAELLGIGIVLVPRDASLLSAIGLGAARPERFAHRQMLLPLVDTVSSGTLAATVEELAAEAAEALRRDGVASDGSEPRRRIARCRYRGQESTLDLEIDEPSVLLRSFEEQYRAVFGDNPAGRAVELESLRVVVSARTTTGLPVASGDTGGESGVVPAPTDRPVWWADGRRPTPVLDRAAVGSGGCAGPALITERHSVTVLEPGWRATAHQETGCLILERTGSARPDQASTVSTSSARSA
ncbi:MAG TPA: hydantoinase/oxoprolinase family protein [Thermoanaerobaculia bacterium]|nr:hydantoinase/oxoprolinase family protein [Thermoanaerobaculia bacterium]